MSDKKFIQEYLEDFSSLIKPDAEIIEKIINVKNALIKVKDDNSESALPGQAGRFVSAALRSRGVRSTLHLTTE